MSDRYIVGITSGPGEKQVEFCEILNEYMDLIPCTAKELSEMSGLSASAISRYRSGQRVPAGREELLKLADNLEKMAKGRLDKRQIKKIRTRMEEALPNLKVDKEAFTERFTSLMDSLALNRKQLAQSVGYDPSFLSKIVTGDRVPSDYSFFADNVAGYVVSSFDTRVIRDVFSGKINVRENAKRDEVRRAVKEWLLFGTGEMEAALDSGSGMESFLKSLDEFDLNDYMKRIHFDKIPVPKSPIKQKNSRSYSGSEGMKKAEIEFLKRTVLSSSMEPVYMYSSLPMEEIAADAAFAKKWMMGLAMVLKKGLHIHIIHETNRPFEEMMLGIESWIPLYMTGLIHPYYLKHVPDKEFDHMIRLSGACAMSGECTSKDLKTAIFYLTSESEGLTGMEIRKELWFKKALPLMDIYRSERAKEYNSVLKEESKKNNPRTVTDKENSMFKNIEIKIFGSECVILSKKNDPPINLVVRHPQLIEAFSHLFS